MPTLDPVDYYGVCEAGIMTLLRTLTFFSSKPIQVTDNRNDINSGSEYWAVFYPSTFTSSKIDAHNYRFVWQVAFDLYVRYKTAKEAPSKFKEVRSSIINLLGVNPTLNGVLGVESNSVAARSELLQDIPGDNPNFLLQSMVVSVTQRVTRKF
jgi:hypothetical protein